VVVNSVGTGTSRNGKRFSESDGNRNKSGNIGNGNGNYVMGMTVDGVLVGVIVVVSRGGTRVTLKATNIVSGTTPTLIVRVVTSSDRGSQPSDYVSQLNAKFHYASWFGDGSKLVRSR